MFSLQIKICDNTAAYSLYLRSRLRSVGDDKLIPYCPYNKLQNILARRDVVMVSRPLCPFSLLAIDTVAIRSIRIVKSNENIIRGGSFYLEVHHMKYLEQVSRLSRRVPTTQCGLYKSTFLVAPFLSPPLSRPFPVQTPTTDTHQTT